MLEERYSFGPYRLDLGKRCIRREERICCKSKTLFSLLRALIDRESNIVTFDELLIEVWPGKQRSYHNVSEHIRRLKAYLTGHEDCIQTHPGEGYSFERPPERPIFEVGTKADLHAARLYAVARDEWNRRSVESVQRALGLFTELAELQPNNPKAQLGIGECLFLLGHVGFAVFRAHESMPKARAAVTRALTLAINDKKTTAAALTVSALISMAFDWKFSVAEKEFDKAISLDPNYGPAHHWRAHLYLYTMRWSQAIDEIGIACSLAPNAPMVHATSGWLLYFMNLTQQAIEVNQETVKLHPDFAPGYMMLGLAYEAGEHYKDAVEAFETSFEIDPMPTPLAAMAHAYAVSGRTKRAEQTLSRLFALKKTRLVSFYFPALVHVGLGNTDTALDLLDQAREDRCDWLIQAGVDPRWKPLHGHPGFTRLLKVVGVTLAS